MTADKKYIMATGVYKPQIRVFELEEMAMKFDRHTTAENVQFLLLSEDWTKSVHLQADRSIEFHSQSGMHYSTRIPKFGRDLAYNYGNCDLLIGGSSSEVYRLNLDQGRFMIPFETAMSGVNAVKINPECQLYAFGGEDGFVEFWDHRSKKQVASLDITQYFNHGFEVSSLQFLPDGLTMAVGTSTGQVLLFDLRYSTPLLIKDHQYNYPIKSIDYHRKSGNIFSVDTKIVKIWDKDSGNIVATVEPPSDINDLCLQQDTGFFMLSNEGVQIQSYYVPLLGPAPKWCSFIDNLTEELEESKSSHVYDNYKFVTKKELESLGMDHLIGTNVLKAYMHGFFVDFKLYEKAKSIANPFAYEEYKKKQIEAKFEAQRKTRISTSLPKVNKKLAKEIVQSSDKKQKSLLEDPRFKELFSNPDFEIVEDSQDFKSAYPSGKKNNPAPESDLENESVAEDSESEDF